MASETSPGKATLVLTFDLDKLVIGAGVEGLSSPLQKLLSEAPSGTQGALAWLPDLSLSEAQTLLNLKTGDLGAYVAVSDADGNALASTFVFVTTAGGQPDAAIGLTLNAPVDLAATPLFGTLLSGVRITDLGVSYASTAFGGTDIVLPAGAPPVTAVPSGLGLTTTVDGNGSAQTFTLPASSSSGSSSSVPLSSASFAKADAIARITPAAGSTEPSVTWFAVQKSLGPLFVDRIGVAAADGTLGLAIDASLTTDVVDIQLTGFTIGFNPGAVASSPPSVSLDGLTVAVDAGPLQIGGSLTRNQTAAGIEYDGAVVIGIGSYAIDAVGSYAVVAGTPSLFVFGLAEGEFGGPPAFFVTGLAAGFGLNRALRLPAPTDVTSFPLVEAAAGNGASDIMSALDQLNAGGWVPPTPGEYWVAAGVKFTSFELVTGFALLTVEFGTELVIALLGMAGFQLPTDTDGGDPYAYVEITLEAVLRPQEGMLGIEALLTPNSFLITKDCQLTGGIAFDLWFGGNAHAGDFVFCAGGYHPDFTPPAWYPSVPRLGFSWHVSDALQITGDSYFAVTPACVMGGGLLAVKFAAGGLSAWFTAQADFIMYWRPFFFDVDVSISIGISYTGSVGFISATFTVELGVSVELWGPPLRGIAHVNWWVISFDVAINPPPAGSGAVGPTPGPTTLADWGTFATTSLPQTSPPQKPPQVGTVCQAQPAGGLQSIVTPAGGGAIWLFGGDTLTISTESAIPASQVTVDGPATDGSATITLPGGTVSVYPLGGNVTVTSVHEVLIAGWTNTIWALGDPMPAALDVSDWGWAAVTGNLPAALWGARGSEAVPALSATAVVPGVTGVSGTGQATVPSGLTMQASLLSVTGGQTRGLVLATTPAGGPGPAPTSDTRQQVAATIGDPAVAALRQQVTAAAVGCGLGAGLTAGTLPLLAAEIDAVLTSQPMLGPLGTTGPPAAASLATAAALDARPAEPATAAAADLTAPALRAVFPPGRDATGGHRPGARPDRPWRLSPGAAAVWDLPAAAAGTLRCAAGTPLWVVALDNAQRPTAAWAAPSADATPAVPPGTTRLAVSAARDLPAAEMADAGMPGDGLAGWTGGSALRQIASQALLGQDAVIRPQSPHMLPMRKARRGRRASREFGTTTGRELVERTWTQGAGGRAMRGWIVTYLPPWCRAITVAIVPSPGAAREGGGTAPRVDAWSWTGDEARPLTLEAHASTGHADGNQVLWQYTVTGPVTGQLAVRAWAPEWWRLNGVIGFAATPAAEDAWPTMRRATGASTTPHGGPAGQAVSRVWWQ